MRRRPGGGAHPAPNSALMEPRPVLLGRIGRACRRRGRARPMSGVMKRMGMIFRAKANKALDRAEDPRETLDYSYQKQLELLQKVRRGVDDVATSRKRLELQTQQLTQQSEKLEGQGRQALAAGREDLAREALTRRSALQ